MTAETDLLPLPEPGEAMSKWAYHEEDMEAYARANVVAATAPLQAEIKALRAEVEQLQRQLRQAHKDYGCELRDPNGTIWEYAAMQRDRAERLAEALRLIESAKDRGFGIYYAHHVAQRALREQEEGK
jgi:hypothetical protein